MPIKNSDRIGPIFSIIMLAIQHTRFNIMSPIDIEWQDSQQKVGYRGRTDYGL